MAETAMEDQIMGCGFMSAMFQLRKFRPRNAVMFQDTSHQHSSKSAKPQPRNKIQTNNPLPVLAKHPDTKPTKPLHTARDMTSFPNNCSNKGSSHALHLAKNMSIASIEPSLDDHQKLGSNRALYRATTGNVMFLGHLGNVNRDKTNQKGPAVKGCAKRKARVGSHQFGNMFSNSTNGLSPDGLKALGNDKYRQGKFEEALELYNQAIAADPSNACYYSNKSAALIGLGCLLEAILPCREAIRIDSSYCNAHCRLANLYLRLGVAEKAIYHYKCSGSKAGAKDIAQAQSLKSCLDRCMEAWGCGDWRKVLDESRNALILGADSTPQILAMKAEALMKLHRHQEAHAIVENALHFNTDMYVELFGCLATAGMLEVHALVYTANGRFDDAVAAIQQALRLDCSDRINSTAKRVQAVAEARLNGNRLFKGSRFSEALIAYNRGLEMDPYNSVLLCNRAACRSKLGQFEKAVEDCTAALLVRPSYGKARLRRATCNAELGKWEAAVEDYEAAMQELPGDEEMHAALSVAKMQLRKMQNG